MKIGDYKGLNGLYGQRPVTGQNSQSFPPTRNEDLLKGELSAAEIKNLKKLGKIDCKACKNRRYVDGSDDPGVSFKTPTKISPSQSGAQVMSHEREHYTREEAKAHREDREVVSNNIRLFHDVCEECGRVYVSGGETATVTRSKQDSEADYFFNKDYREKLAPHFPDKIEAFV